MATLRKTLVLLAALATIGTSSIGSKLDFKLLDLFPPIQGWLTSSFEVYNDSVPCVEESFPRLYKQVIPSVMTSYGLEKLDNGKYQVINSTGRTVHGPFSRGVYFIRPEDTGLDGEIRKITVLR